MAKIHFRPYNPNQTVLFPQRIDEDIADNDPAVSYTHLKVYQVEIRGKKGENAHVYFMYYSLQTSGIYQPSDSFPFIDEGVKGTEEEPFTISLQPVVNLSLIHIWSPGRWMEMQKIRVRSGQEEPK